MMKGIDRLLRKIDEGIEARDFFIKEKHYIKNIERISGMDGSLFIMFEDRAVEVDEKSLIDAYNKLKDGK